MGTMYARRSFLASLLALPMIGRLLGATTKPEYRFLSSGTFRPGSVLFDGQTWYIAEGMVWADDGQYATPKPVPPEFGEATGLEVIAQDNPHGPYLRAEYGPFASHLYSRRARLAELEMRRRAKT